MRARFERIISFFLSHALIVIELHELCCLVFLQKATVCTWSSAVATCSCIYLREWQRSFFDRDFFYYLVVDKELLTVSHF